MPLYRTVTRPGLLDLEQRTAFSNDVVEVHCDVTGAPPSFVHVLYVEDEAQVPEGQHAVVVGTIRHGRTDEQKGEIRSRLAARFAEHVGVSPDTVTVQSIDIDASYTMEGGVLLPEPGSEEEEAWKTADA